MQIEISAQVKMDKNAEHPLSRIPAAEQDAGLRGGPSMYRLA
jgi:hypothetical protein